MPMTCSTPPDEVLRVFIYGWLEEYFAKSSNERGMHHNVLHMMMSGIIQWSWCLLPPVHIFWAGHQSKL
jgi:hypothetical protein